MKIFLLVDSCFSGVFDMGLGRWLWERCMLGKIPSKGPFTVTGAQKRGEKRESQENDTIQRSKRGHQRSCEQRFLGNDHNISYDIFLPSKKRKLKKISTVSQRHLGISDDHCFF